MYKLEKLPYEYDALEPFIDTHTLGLHKNKHEQNYLNKLNSLLIKNNYDFNYSLKGLPSHIDEFLENDKEDILFNLGGVLNHELYFNSMSPMPEIPSIELHQIILETFKSFDNFKKEFKEAALSLKGSGYTMLVLDKNKLKIVNLYNQDNPYNHNYIPLIALDVWEHAYYINYENKRDLYIDNFFIVMDFKNANKIFNGLL